MHSAGALRARGLLCRGLGMTTQSALGSGPAANLAPRLGFTTVLTMHRVRKWLTAAVFGVIALSAAPSPSFGRTPTKVEWQSVRVPPGKDEARMTRLLKNLLKQAAKKADFGQTKAVKLSARVVTFTSEQRGDVQQVTCTMVGRVVGGQSAKSRISFGGSPAEREKLEKQVLAMVANGLVTRLAQITRAKSERDAKAAAEAEAEREAAEAAASEPE
jgi:hypothetical protein